MNYKNEAISVLKSVCKLFPEQPLSTHIAMALEEYPSFDGISDKELYFILEKYKCEKELDHIIPHDEDIQKIIKDATDLDSLSSGIYEDDYED